MIPLTEVMVCWNRRGAARLVPWPDESRLSEPFDCTSGACFGIHHLTAAQRREFILLVFVNMVWRDKVPADVAYNTLLGIQEFSDAMWSYEDVVFGTRSSA